MKLTTGFSEFSRRKFIEKLLDQNQNLVRDVTETLFKIGQKSGKLEPYTWKENILPGQNFGPFGEN